MSFPRWVWAGLCVATLSSALVLACVGDVPAVPDASTPLDAGIDAKDASTPIPDGAPDTAVPEAGPCSNPLVGNVVSVFSGGVLPFIPGSGPLVVGDYVLTSFQLYCNGACSANAALVGGLHVTSPGVGLITVERRLELQDALTDAGPVKLLDKWTGTFDQLNRAFQVDEVCPAKFSDAGWNGGFPVIDGGSNGELKIRFHDVQITVNNGKVGALMTFTKK